MSHPPFSTTFRVNFKLQAAWVPAVGGGAKVPGFGLWGRRAASDSPAPRPASQAAPHQPRILQAELALARRRLGRHRLRGRPAGRPADHLPEAGDSRLAVGQGSLSWCSHGQARRLNLLAKPPAPARADAPPADWEGGGAAKGPAARAA